MSEGKESNGALKPYEMITEKIVELLEAGHVPWRKPWTGLGEPRNLHSGRTYRGVNLFLLTCLAMMAGYTSSWWVTYRQARELGGHVRKGEKSSPVVFWKILEYDRDGANAAEHDHGDGGDDDTKKRVPLLRYYNVFNALHQCEGLSPPAEATQPTLNFVPIEACERIVSGMPTPPTIRHGAPRAYYRPSEDLVNMPARELFASVEAYYGTLFHELVHSTGHASRLARESVKDSAPFGSPTYAREELVAEMGAAFLCGRARIEQATIENTAAYIGGWLKSLREDAKLVVIAAAQAQRAADFILSEQPSERPEASPAPAVASAAERALREKTGR